MPASRLPALLAAALVAGCGSSEPSTGDFDPGALILNANISSNGALVEALVSMQLAGMPSLPLDGDDQLSLAALGDAEQALVSIGVPSFGTYGGAIATGETRISLVFARDDARFDYPLQLPPPFAVYAAGPTSPLSRAQAMYIKWDAAQGSFTTQASVSGPCLLQGQSAQPSPDTGEMEIDPTAFDPMFTGECDLEVQVSRSISLWPPLLAGPKLQGSLAQIRVTSFTTVP
jgi:hypothetical protein